MPAGNRYERFPAVYLLDDGGLQAERIGPQQLFLPVLRTVTVLEMDREVAVGAQLRQKTRMQTACGLVGRFRVLGRLFQPVTVLEHLTPVILKRYGSLRTQARPMQQVAVKSMTKVFMISFV